MPKADLSRTQVQDLGKRGVSPAGAPRPAYVVAPATPTGANKYNELAKSLGSFNPALSQIAAQGQADAAKAQQKAEEATRARAEGRIAGMTLQEIQQDINDGKMPDYDDPAAKAVIDKDMGRRVAGQVASELREQIAKGDVDLATADLEALSQEAANANLSDASSPHFTRGFLDTLNVQMGALANEGEKQRLGQFAESRADATHSTLRSVILGADPADAAQTLATANAELKQTLRVDDDELARVTFSIAEELAITPGNAEKVKAITEEIKGLPGMGEAVQALRLRAENTDTADKMERNFEVLSEYDAAIFGMDGEGATQAPDLLKQIDEDPNITPADKRSLRNNVRNRQAQIKASEERQQLRIAKEQEKYRQQRLEQETLSALQGRANAAVASGQGWAIDDQTVTVGDREVTLKGDDARRAALQNVIFEQISHLPDDVAGDPAAVNQIIAEATQSTHITHRPWELLMSGAATVADTRLLDADEDAPIPTKIVQGYEVYSSVSRKVADEHIKDEKSRVLFETIAYAENTMGLTRDQAMRHAIDRMENYDPAQIGSVRALSFKAAADVDMDGFFGLNGQTDKYASGAATWIAKDASLMAAVSGMGPADAVEESAKRYRERHALVGDYPVEVPAGYSREEFGPMAQDFLETIQPTKSKDKFIFNPVDYSANFKDVPTMEDPRLVTRDGGKTYRLYDGPLPGSVKHTFTLSDIERLSAARKEAEDQEARERALNAEKERERKLAKPINPITGQQF